jgi:hypothetical protein
MPDFLPGDVGLCGLAGPLDIVGEVVAVGESTPEPCRWKPVHAFVLDSSYTLIEAAEHVQVVPVAKYTSTDSQPSVILRIRSLTDEQRLAVAERARSLLTASYGFGDVVAAAVDKALSWLTGRDVVAARKLAPFRTERDCSVLVAQAVYDTCGWSFCRLPAQAVEPADIWCDYLERPGEYEVVFCSPQLTKYLPKI